uniref:Uncharacterized protein n=1 Tax=Arundo donax TaxID=35708 RepID=A0A0A9D878_ARUDO
MPKSQPRRSQRQVLAPSLALSRKGKVLFCQNHADQDQKSWLYRRRCSSQSYHRKPAVLKKSHHTSSTYQQELFQQRHWCPNNGGQQNNGSASLHLCPLQQDHMQEELKQVSLK